MLYERIHTESQRLQQELDSLKQKILNLPEGKFYLTRNQNRFKWFRTIGQNHMYIHKKDRNLAEQLAMKKYLLSRFEDLSHEKKALDFYLRHHHSDYGKSEELLTQPGYQELLAPAFTPLSQELAAWANAPFEKNPKFPQQLIHKTSSGNLVRSKSEALIDMILYTNKIPFRYECALKLGYSTIYPDLTIRHPQTGDTYYWEHFGRMDDPAYSKNVSSKLQLYIANNITPSLNLITTYETSERPLSTEVIEKLVAHYFL